MRYPILTNGWSLKRLKSCVARSDYAKLQKDITFYTGHCTGNGAFDYLRRALGERVQAIQTGKELEV